MRKIITSLLLLFSALPALLSQSLEEDAVVVPDQEKIRIGVLSNASPFFYPNLFDRYVHGDTTLNLEEYQHLYYGYVYQENYRPLENMNYRDSIVVALSINKSDSTISPEIFDMISRYTDKALLVEPFNMGYLNYKAYIEAQKGDIEAARKIAYKLNMVKQTIFSSGTGTSDKSPWHILYRSDKQDILNSLGVRFTKSIYVTSDIEYLHLPVRNNGNRGYYFNVSRLYMKRPEAADRDVKQKRKFEINSEKNPRSSQHIKFQPY